MAINRKIFSLLIFTIIFSFIFLPTVLRAEPAGEGDPIVDPWAEEGSGALEKLKTIGGGAYGVGDAEPKKPVEIVGEVIKIGLNVIGLVFLILMLYGGYLWMTARGDEQKLTKSKNTLEAAAIGIIIVLAAYGITYFVVNQLMTEVL